ncbi:hypothetical protein Cgig2_021933 [Carnegiea gigantea]|uniref:DNA-directed RNA polymerase n=1 Tax=Carnegiea gigantea TaxID=171969 RepID=A0A9Q1JLK3_9CARY|nr:hypothetical protein Cgig2_021933 [Carnegiea gigantea]
MFFVLAVPVVTYEITDGLNLATLFPHDLFQERDNVQLRVVNYIFYGNGKATRKISNTRDTLVTFIYEKSRSGDITQGLPKVEQVLEVQSIDSISRNLEKRIYGWNKHITRILRIFYGFLIGAELTMVQSHPKGLSIPGVQIHNRHIKIIVRQITSKVLVSEDGMANIFLPGEQIGLLWAERTGRALEEAICYRVILLGITRAS